MNKENDILNMLVHSRELDYEPCVDCNVKATSIDTEDTDGHTERS